MLHFTIETLKHDRLADAWPVARMCAGHANPDWWVHEADLLIGRGGGVLAVRAPDGMVHGIATYEPIESQFSGRILAVDLLTTFELSRKAPAKSALCAALDDLSLALECDAVAFALPSASLHN